MPEADKIELDVIDEVFCRNRNNKLLVGSVTSNIGYAEAASGINSITKVYFITFQNFWINKYILTNITIIPINQFHYL